MTKHEIRKAMLAKRSNMTDALAKSHIIIDKLKKAISEYNSFFIYISFENEVHTLDLISYLLKNNKKVSVPVCNTNDFTIIPAQLSSLDGLVKNNFGILEPKEVIKANYNFDTIIIPGVAFDKTGNRIGFGKGYYDRYLLGIDYECKKIALCHDFQLLEKIPSEEHDVKMDLIFTQNNTITINHFVK